MIYLDHNATTPVDPAALEAAARCEREAWANPSSVHGPGRKARAAIEDARAVMAGVLGAAEPGNIFFVASGSEANNLALHGAALRHAAQTRKGEPFHVVSSAIEHDCIHSALIALADRFAWFSFTEVPADASGRVDPADFERAMRPETKLAVIMHANNETGVAQPVEEIAALAHDRGARVLADAVQSYARMPVDVDALGADFLTIAAHKFYGPRGAAALYARHPEDLTPIVNGSGQERGMHAGTENAPAIAGMAAAAQLHEARRTADAEHQRAVEAAFLEALREAKLPFEINGDLRHKLPGVVNLSVFGPAHDDLVVGMDLAGVAISAGAACNSGVIGPSRILKAMGLPESRTRGAVRISFGRGNDAAEARAAAAAFVKLCARLGVQFGAAPSAMMETTQ